MAGISLAVATIPEALPAVVALSLAAATRRMAARGAIVQLGVTPVSSSDHRPVWRMPPSDKPAVAVGVAKAHERNVRRDRTFDPA